MTAQLIPVVPATIGHQTVQTVDGRALHTFLKVETRFNDWIVRRIEDYGFEENTDFYSFLSKTQKGGRPAQEYTLSLDMAKELAMVERTPKGKEARQYFIECERRLSSKSQPQSSNDVLAAQLAELFKGKVLVDFEPLARLTRLVYAMEAFLPQIVPLAQALEQQCGRPIVADLAAFKAPPVASAPQRGKPK